MTRRQNALVPSQNFARGLLALLAFAAAPFVTNSARGATNDLVFLSDEFSSAATINDWTRRYAIEAPGVNSLERWEINAADAPGAMLMMPYTVTWYQPYRGPLAYKTVSGDFVFTTHVDVENRQGTGVPASDYSLAGVMIRTPPAAPSAAENYIFLSLGHGSNAGSPQAQFEVKTTVNGSSHLELTTSETLSVDLQIARLGDTVVALFRRPDEDWTVHRVFDRSDFPDEMQIGLVAYTDWNKVASYTAAFHNANVLNPPIAGDPSSNPQAPFQPDIVARFDYARFVRPTIPPGVDPATASDATLLSFLGDSASWPYQPGDANLDGMVDRRDLAQLSAHYGATGDASWTDGDFNADQAVTLADLAMLTLSGEVGAPSPAVVAEPSTSGLAALALASFITTARRGRRGKLSVNG